jgi:hypothetical protein
MQRGSAIGLRRIHVGVLLDQFHDGGLVPAHHGVRNFGGSGGAQSDSREA